MYRPLIGALFKFLTECLPLIFFQICLVISSRSKSEIKNNSSSSNSIAILNYKHHPLSVECFEEIKLKEKPFGLTRNSDIINSFMNN